MAGDEEPRASESPAVIKVRMDRLQREVDALAEHGSREAPAVLNRLDTLERSLSGLTRELQERRAFAVRTAIAAVVAITSVIGLLISILATVH